MDRFDDIVSQIVTMEWDMFQAVNEGGPRASSQEDPVTFAGVRRRQLEASPEDACQSYLDDLLLAELVGRNLVMEKYIHMMKNTAPAQYAELIQAIPMPEEPVLTLAHEISDKLLSQTETLVIQYPLVTGAGRPLRSVSDCAGVTSIETYQLGELLTYSEETLRALKAHLEALENQGRMLAREKKKKSVRCYGYPSLDEAEAAAKRRLNS